MVTTLQPWASPNPTKAIVYAYETLRISAILLEPYMPTKAAELLDRLGIDSSQRGWNQCVFNDKIDVGQLVKGLKDDKRPGHLFPPVK
jgi:methionyl-tRNA synthetase